MPLSMTNSRMVGNPDITPITERDIWRTFLPNSL